MKKPLLLLNNFIFYFLIFFTNFIIFGNGNEYIYKLNQSHTSDLELVNSDIKLDTICNGKLIEKSAFNSICRLHIDNNYILSINDKSFIMDFKITLNKSNLKNELSKDSLNKINKRIQSINEKNEYNRIYKIYLTNLLNK